MMRSTRRLSRWLEINPLETVYGILRQAYQRDIEMLRKLDDTFFHPGEYVYERTKDAISHCQEHMQELVLSHP
jgi:hypothetical protein